MQEIQKQKGEAAIYLIQEAVQTSEYLITGNNDLTAKNLACSTIVFLEFLISPPVFLMKDGMFSFG